LSDATPQPGRLQDNRLPAEAVGPAPRATLVLTSPTEAQDAFAGMQQIRSGLVQPLRRPPTVAQADAEKRAEGATLLRPLQPAQPPTESTQAPPPTHPGRLRVEPEPLRSFVGTEKSALNRYLGQAEAALRSGQYYKAQGLYDIARTIDPGNPLPLLGRAIALLAAGEYVSSAESLFRAIELYEDLSQFPVELTSFLPDVKMLDRRRADLEQRLQSQENHRLRFLLGYAEYTSGLQKLGLANMQRAAGEAPAELDHLRRFVAALEARTAAARPAP
jgi:tetratricopeptide (TPR) repeat protein